MTVTSRCLTRHDADPLFILKPLDSSTLTQDIYSLNKHILSVSKESWDARGWGRRFDALKLSVNTVFVTSRTT